MRRRSQGCTSGPTWCHDTYDRRYVRVYAELTREEEFALRERLPAPKKDTRTSHHFVVHSGGEGVCGSTGCYCFLVVSCWFLPQRAAIFPSPPRLPPLRYASVFLCVRVRFAGLCDARLPFLTCNPPATAGASVYVCRHSPLPSLTIL